MNKVFIGGIIAMDVLTRIYRVLKTMQAQNVKQTQYHLQDSINILEKLIQQVLFQDGSKNMIRQANTEEKLILAIDEIVQLIEQGIQTSENITLNEESCYYYMLLQKHFINLINDEAPKNLCEIFLSNIFSTITYFENQLEKCRNIPTTISQQQNKNIQEFTQVDLQIIQLNQLKQEIQEYQTEKHAYLEFFYLPNLDNLKQNILSIESSIYFNNGNIDNKWQKFVNKIITFYLDNSNFKIKLNELNKQALNIVIFIICNTKWEKRQEQNIQQLLIQLSDVKQEYYQIVSSQECFEQKINKMRNKVYIQQNYKIIQTEVWLQYIVKLYLELQGWNFVSPNQLKIDKYCPINRNILLTIIKQFGKFGQSKFIDPVKVVEYLESKFGQLEYEIYLQLKLGANQVQNLFESKQIITIIDRKQFIKSSKYIEKLTQKLDLLTIPSGQYDKPSILKLESVTKANYFSKCITIAISGFTSEDENKSVKWQGFDKGVEFNSQVVGLTYPSCTEIEAVFNGVEISAKFFISRQYDAIKYNCYGQAEEEAQKAASYFSELFGQLFPRQIVNIACFSLGSVFTNRLIAELDKISMYTNQVFINDVLVMGGAAEKKRYECLSLASIGGRLINVYSKNDLVLRYLLNGFGKVVQYLTTQPRSEPVGVSQILHDSGRVLNYDLTYLVDGHTNYQNNYSEIIKRVNFHNYYI